MADSSTSPVSESPVLKKVNNLVPSEVSSFDSAAARIATLSYGVTPTMPFSSLADPDASSVADLIQSIPGVTYTPHKGVALPDPASKLGELCGDFLSGLCTDPFCPLLHPPCLLLAGAVCALMSRYCQPVAQPQPSPVSPGGEGTKMLREKWVKLRTLFLKAKKVDFDQEPVTSDETFVKHCNQECVQQLCGRKGPRGYLYYEAKDIYKSSPELVEYFQELAEHCVNKYNLEENENLEAKKVLKANVKDMFVYMTIEAWDKRTDFLRTLIAAVWVKGYAKYMVGIVKDVTVSV